jgi:hypothetical protein
LSGADKAQCALCHPAPFYLNQQMHDLHLERFLKEEAGDDPIKSFTLRGIKDRTAVPPRWPVLEPGRHCRVLQFGTGIEAHERRKAGLGGVSAPAMT